MSGIADGTVYRIEFVGAEYDVEPDHEINQDAQEAKDPSVGDSTIGDVSDIVLFTPAQLSWNARLQLDFWLTLLLFVAAHFWIDLLAIILAATRSTYCVVRTNASTGRTAGSSRQTQEGLAQGGRVEIKTQLR